MISKLTRHLVIPISMLIVTTSCQQNDRIEKGDAPAKAVELAEQYLNLQNSSAANLQSLELLYEWSGIGENTKISIIRSHYFDLDVPIQKITFEKWGKIHTSRFYNPQTKPNIPPKWIMIIHYKTNTHQTLELPIGLSQDGSFKFINARADSTE